MKYDLVAIGNPVYDFITTSGTSSDRRVPSGCSTNVCLAAKRLGMRKVMLIGNVGADFNQDFEAEMTRHGIKVMNTGTTDRTTGFRIKYDTTGERTLTLIADAGRIPVGRVWAECRRARYILIGPIFGEVEVAEVADLVGTSSSAVLLDPQGLMRRLGSDGQVEHFCEREQLRKLIEVVEFVKPNRIEAQFITGERDSLGSAKKLTEWGAGAAIVTLGGGGSIVCDRRTCFQVPAFKTRALDPTGAGEFYAGAFLAELARTGDISSSCFYASAAASIMIERPRPEIPLTQREVRRRTRAILRLGQCRGLSRAVPSTRTVARRVI